MYTYIYGSLKVLWNVDKSSTHLYRPQQRKQHAQHDEKREGVISTMKIRQVNALKPRVFISKVRKSTSDHGMLPPIPITTKPGLCVGKSPTPEWRREQK